MEQAKILIVDDDQDIRDSLQAILAVQEHTTITAANASEGMEKAKAENPDLVILDVMMETWQDGFEMARQLRKDEQLKDVRILMLTGVKDLVIVRSGKATLIVRKERVEDIKGLVRDIQERQ